MALRLTSGPAVLPLTLAEAKDHLRVEHSDEDDLITRLIETATQHVDGIDGILGRACITQTWTLTLDAFPAAIILPLPPCQSVDAITYIDTDGASQTLAVSGYPATGVGGAARVHPAFDTQWPATRVVPEAVSVTFTAGYGDTGADVPAPIRSAILMHVAHLYEHRETVTALGYLKELPHGYHALVSDYRMWGF